MGMEMETVVYTGQKTIDVELADRNESLDDVVVTGYSKIRKEGFTGNVTRISKEELAKVSQKDVIGAIQVFDPSFRITENIQMGSNPNAMPEFYMRGQTAVNMEFSTADISRQNLTSNNNLPIFILDGFEVSVEKIYDMDPQRIHSVTLLKDAAATAMYGSRAANGVVVIESRAPQPGRLRVSYNFTATLETPDLSAYNLMNAREKVQAEYDAGYYNIDPDPTNSDVTALSHYRQYLLKLNNVNRGVDTDWMSQAVRNSFHHKHSLYIDGGDKDIRWGVELKYDGTDGVMKGSDRQTYGAGITLDYRIGKLQILNRTDFDSMNSNDVPYQDFSTYAHQQPYDVMTDPVTGKYVRTLSSWGAMRDSPLNPMYEAQYMKSFDKSKYNDFTNKLSLNFFATNDITVKVQFSLDKKYTESNRFIDPASSNFGNETNPNYLGSLDNDKGESFSYNLNALFMYNKSIKKNYINVTAGAELLESKLESVASSYTGFPSGSLSSVNNAMRIVSKPVRSSNHTRMASLIVMANYSYDDIYLLDASFRLDGSSEFGADKKTAPFWAAGAGLNIHKYQFLRNNPVLSTLKLRATYGQVGKVNFPVYAAKSSYISTSTQNWYLTGMGNMLQYLGNEDLTWEKTNSIDAGIDLGLFKDRLLLKATYYNKQTNGMITSVSLPTSSGFSSYMANMGSVENQGFEIDLRYNIIRTTDWDLTVFGNLAHNRNKIKEISEALKNYNKMVDQQYADYDRYKENSKYFAQYSTTYKKFVEGGSTTSIFAMKSLGINPANGQELYLRPDGTVTYEWSAADQVIVGNTEPKAQGSFGFNFRWKNFSLFTSFLYRWGGQQYNNTLVSYVENVNMMTSNADRRVGLLRWKKAGDVAPFKDIAESKYITRPTSRFVQKDNTLQFNSISLSYDFDQKLIRKAHIGMLRLTASMEDLGYWSTIRRERGLAYPYSHLFNFTLNVTF